MHEHQQFELKGENYGNGESAKWDRFEAWFQGECPCDQPDCSEGHWRREFRIPRPRSATVLAV
ncbi:hypothetical protein GA0070620_6512 [Micromonospora krabiensis]|uniref:Uncharacterized protein n=1 Tax=Micromonospora krabiensis TaxID=307121 RepID=A0A1C3NE83_9ACTN|nr:hypothetical protein GA0070620_6512 [Micromonospora krabiensis]